MTAFRRPCAASFISAGFGLLTATESTQRGKAGKNNRYGQNRTKKMPENASPKWLTRTLGQAFGFVAFMVG